MLKNYNSYFLLYQNVLILNNIMLFFTDSKYY